MWLDWSLRIKPDTWNFAPEIDLMNCLRFGFNSDCAELSRWSIPLVLSHRYRHMKYCTQSNYNLHTDSDITVLIAAWWISEYRPIIYRIFPKGIIDDWLQVGEFQNICMEYLDFSFWRISILEIWRRHLVILSRCNRWYFAGWWTLKIWLFLIEPIILQREMTKPYTSTYKIITVPHLGKQLFSQISFHVVGHM